MGTPKHAPKRSPRTRPGAHARLFCLKFCYDDDAAADWRQTILQSDPQPFLRIKGTPSFFLSILLDVAGRDAWRTSARVQGSNWCVGLARNILD